MSGTFEKAELTKWSDAMDKLLGANGVEQDIAKGVRMARACRHEDSVWLCALFPNDKPVPSKEEMKQVLLAQGEDIRALVFASMIARRDRDLVESSAEVGYAPAQAWFAGFCRGREQFEWASKAAAQRDRNGLVQLAMCWRDGCGVSEDDAKAMQLFKEAAELGHAKAQLCYGHGFDKKSWERYFWWGQAVARGYETGLRELAEAAAEHLRLFDMGEGSGRVMFEIGSACKGHLGDDKLFCYGILSRSHNAMRRAVVLHDKWCEDAKRGVC